jgi:3-oxoacyl-[acyl-carrier-protein] synthase-3
MERGNPVGIAGIGTHIPSTFITGIEIARRAGLPESVVTEKMGLKRKTIAGPEDHTNQMGIWAAKKAIRQAGIDPQEIDLVICTTEEWKEHFLWVAGIKMAYDLGATRAWAIDVGLKCATTMAALKLAKNMMLADDSINVVLVAGGYRNGDYVNYANPRTRFMYNLAAGGGAFLLRKNHPRNLVLETAIRVDGAFSEDVITGAGGTIRPLTPELLAMGAHYLDVPDPEGMKERLDARSMRNFVGVIRDSLDKSGYTDKDIDYLAILHMKRSAHDYVLGELGLRQDQAIYLENYGHIGQQDQALSLQLAQEQGKLNDGDIVVMVGAGIGYAWGATTLRWGSQGTNR